MTKRRLTYLLAGLLLTLTGAVRGYAADDISYLDEGEDGLLVLKDFKDFNKLPATPLTVRWRVNDRTSGTQLIDWMWATNVGTTTNIIVPRIAQRIVKKPPSPELEEHVITTEWSYQSGGNTYYGTRDIKYNVRSLLFHPGPTPVATPTP